MAAVHNCARAVGESTDVTADSITADYSSNVIEGFRREAEGGDGRGERYLRVNCAKKFHRHPEPTVKNESLQCLTCYSG